MVGLQVRLRPRDARQRGEWANANSGAQQLANLEFTAGTSVGRSDEEKMCAVLITLPIAGGCDNRKNDLERCRIEAVCAYPDAKTRELSDYANFVTPCMEA